MQTAFPYLCNMAMAMHVLGVSVEAVHVRHAIEAVHVTHAYSMEYQDDTCTAISSPSNGSLK
jgi:hypothetical protein